MILTCPSCGTQYVVKDGAIPPEGRQVRCAACKHSWHQDPEPGGAGEAQASGATQSETPPAGAADAEPPPAQQIEPTEDAPASRSEPIPQDEALAEEEQEESLAEATLIEPRSGPEAEERAYEEAMVAAGEDQPTAESPPPATTPPAPAQPLAAEQATSRSEAADWGEPPMGEAEGDTFEGYFSPDEEAPRRRNALVPFLVILLAVAAVAALLWFLAPPEWKAQLGIGGAGASPLALVTTHMDRQRLESGNELLTVTGRVINPTSKEQPVPPLQAQLKSRTGQVVHSWTIAPPARTLPPGASRTFNSAEVNVPPGGEELTITVGPSTS